MIQYKNLLLISTPLLPSFLKKWLLNFIKCALALLVGSYDFSVFILGQTVALVTPMNALPNIPTPV